MNAPVLPQLATKRLLVVEDSRMVAGFMKKELERHGFSVTAARSLAEAMQCLDEAREPFFAAILDLHLPDAPDGEVVDLVLAEGVPVVVLTSLVDAQIRERIEAKGVVEYVLKSPTAMEQVAEILVRLEKNRGISLLVAEDSGVLRRVIRDYLQRFGFRVLEARDGQEALTLLEAHPEVPLVITDYLMPKLDGLELCAAIRRFAPKDRLAVIGISSTDSELLSVRFLKAGANDFLTKPFQREELYTRIIQNLETLEHIRHMEHSLQTIRRLHGRMQRDLEAAARLQQSLLPKELPHLPGLTAACRYHPCDELSGDCFNIFQLDEHRLGIFVVDVSGHGVAAALLSVTLSRMLGRDPAHGSLLFAEAGALLSPAEVCTRLNEQFPMNSENFQYFTILYGLLDSRSGEFRYCSAGHPGPVRIRPGAEALEPMPPNTAIGFLPGITFQESSLALHPGDRLFFYTDGIVEARDPGGEEFGSERFRACLQGPGAESLEAVLESVYGQVQRWTGGVFTDDITLCALEYAPAPRQAAEPRPPALRP